jgi:hypothetical protein
MILCDNGKVEIKGHVVIVCSELAYLLKYLFFAERAFARMRDNGIKGSKLYMLWNDCCDRDISKAVDIMINEPIDSIVEHINYERGRGIPYSGYVCKVIKEVQNET